MVARSVPVEGLGRFGLVFATYLVILGGGRALNSEPLVVRYSDVTGERWRQAVARSTGGALATGAVAGLACMFIGVMLGAGRGAPLAVLAVSLPGLLLLDSWRFAFLAAGRPRSAAACDAAWALVQFPLLTLYARSGHPSVAGCLFCWGFAASAAGLFGVWKSGIVPRLRAAPAWWRQQGDLGVRYAGEFLATDEASQASLYGISAVAGVAAVGSFKAGRLVLGPLSMFSVGVMLVSVPEAVRALGRSAVRLRQMTVLVSALLGLAGLLWGGIALLLPDQVGRALLGANWNEGRAVLLPLVVTAVGAGVAAGPMIGLRALAAARQSLRISLIVAPLTLAGSVVGAALAGARGAAWGLASTSVLASLLWWARYNDVLAPEMVAGQWVGIA